MKKCTSLALVLMMTLLALPCAAQMNYELINPNLTYTKLEADEAYVDDATEIKRIIEVIMKGSQDVPKFNR